MTIRNYCILTLFLFLGHSIYCQEKFTLSGIVSDASSNETLIGVNIIFPELKTGATTNEYGFYSITLPNGTYEVVISYLGYQTQTETINLSENQKKDFSLISII